MILFEQVSGFAAHEHRSWIERALHTIGYRIVWQKLLDVAYMLGTTRPRWLAVAVRVHSEFQPVMLSPFTMTQPPDEEQRAKFPLSAIDFASLQLGNHMIALASDPAFGLQHGPSKPGTPSQMLIWYTTSVE